MVPFQEHIHNDWRNQAITLIDPWNRAVASTMSVMAMLRQQSAQSITKFLNRSVCLQAEKLFGGILVAVPPLF
jgi:hypothetical protein